MLRDLVPAVALNAEREAQEIQAAIDADGKNFELKLDYSTTPRKCVKLNTQSMANKLNNTLNSTVLKDGVFYAMNQLFGITFKERDDIPVYHPDVEVYEVFDVDGSSLGLFYADYYARESKRGGAWFCSFRSQSELLNQKPVILNNMNITKAPEGEPTLLSFDEVSTMFHEMGHALHGMFSDVKYPSSGY